MRSPLPIDRIRARWNVALRPKPALLALRSALPLRRGVTVVIVNWNALAFLREVIPAVRRMSPPSTRVLVVDNGSTDGSLEWLSAAGVRTVALGGNFGHGTAADIGVYAARSRSFVLLDVDAFPISPRWLDALTGPLDRGAAVAGAHGGDVLDRRTPTYTADAPRRDFVHPCCVAMRWRRFVLRRHSFRKFAEAGALIDVGVDLSRREAGRLAFLEPTSHIGPGVLGTVFGEVVYHNFYGTRHGGAADELIEGVGLSDALRTWRAALDRYLPAGPVSDAPDLGAPQDAG